MNMIGFVKTIGLIKQRETGISRYTEASAIEYISGTINIIIIISLLQDLLILCTCQWKGDQGLLLNMIGFVKPLEH